MGSTRWPFSMMCDGEDFDGISKLVKSTVLGFWSTMLERQERKLPKKLDRFQDSLDLLLWCTLLIESTTEVLVGVRDATKATVAISDSGET